MRRWHENLTCVALQFREKWLEWVVWTDLVASS